MEDTQTPFEEEYKKVLLVKELITNTLAGKNEPFCFDQEPSRKYSLGIITPLSEDETSLSEEKQSWILKRRPNSIGFEARINPQDNAFNVKLAISFSVYYRSVPTYDEQLESLNLNEVKDIAQDTTKVRLRQKYTRKDLNITDINFTVHLPDEKQFLEIDTSSITDTINQQLNCLAEEIKVEPDCWITGQKEPTIPLSSMKTADTFKQVLPTGEKEAPNWKIKTGIKIWPSENNHWRLSLLIANETDSNVNQHQSSLFDTHILCDLEKAEYIAVPFKAAELDYRYTTQSWGKGINCVFEVKHPQSAITETTPVYIQPRTTSRLKMDETCNFKKLSNENYVDTLYEVVSWLKQYAQEWIEENKRHINDINYTSRVKGLQDFTEEIKRFEFGIEALKADERLARSFRLMNEVFSRGSHKNWRLFQLVFIVTQMPSLLARENQKQEYLEELNKVDVLWFPTGGGKTEAYFGVIVTAMFFDRFRGKTRGVTAWLRYPLRMLSIQQLQRLVDIVVQAENVRIESNDRILIASDPFSIGYYVGSGNTPNELTYPPAFKKQDPIYDYKDEVDKATNINDLKLLVLQRCPHCGSSNLGILVDIEQIRIRHICKDCNKEAPIYISDSEIYRYAPSVIVGTVDRLARAGQISLFSHLYGSFTHKCPKHGYLSFGQCVEPACTVNKSLYIKLEPLHDPSPALLLQDELHLLKESLGTYDAHYETFLDLLSKNIGNGLPSKRLAATATIEGYKDHVWELYGKDAIRFPVKGRGEFDSAYVEPSIKDKYARLYMGIMPTGSSTEETVSTILKALKTYTAACKTNENWSESIISNYDLGLAYVNEKNTAGNLRSRWDEFSDMNSIQVLTGDKGLGEVRSVIGRVESDEKTEFDNRLRAIVATSIISHGVDLARLNFMTFCGMPNHAADYIQASSRVGRSHVGIVFTVFRPDNNRERNIYQRFHEFHERLYQLVQPVPINRFSESSVKRTLSGILSACILNILPLQKGRNFDRSKDFIVALEDGLISDEELISLVKQSYLIDTLNLTGAVVDFFNRLISGLVKDQRRMIKEVQSYKTFMSMRPTPVSSLREVSEQVKFSVSFKSNEILDKILAGRKNKHE